MAKKRGPKKDGNVEERRVYIKNYLDNYGYFSVPAAIKKEIAETFSVTVNQIDSDIRAITNKIQIPAVKELGQKFTQSYKKAMREAQRLMNSDDTSVKAKGIDLLNKTMQGFTKFMEDYGHKEKVAEKTEIEVVDTLGDIVKKNRDQFKKLPKEAQTKVQEILKNG